MRSVRTTAGAALLVTVSMLMTALSSAPPAHAAEKVLGSGSTFAEVALDQWAADAFRSAGLEIEFNGIGSRGGLNQFQQGVVDFASSDVPYPETESTSRAYAYLPIVAGGTAILYNLVDPAGKRIENLRLSPRTIALIFFAEITTWRDQRILDENPDLTNRLPDIEIKRAVRSSGSGTTGVFTDFLSTTAPDLWTAFVQKSQMVTQAGGNYTTDWPQSIAGQFNCQCSQFAGSNEIANLMAQNTPGARGSIGYAETAYAIQLGLPVAAVKNTAGLYRLPTARNVAVALLEATENGDGTQNLEGVFVSPREEAYPASSYNYIVIPTDDLSPGKGETLGNYVIYSITAGQAKSDSLGYSPLPPNLVQFALNRVPLINGSPAPPPLGDWGKYYEALGAEVVVDVPDTTSPPTTAAPTATTAPAGGTAANTQPAGGTPAGGTTATTQPAGGTPAGGTPTTQPAGGTTATNQPAGGTAPGGSTGAGSTGSGSTGSGSTGTGSTGGGSAGTGSTGTSSGSLGDVGTVSVDPITGQEVVTVTSIAQDGSVVEIRIPAASGSLASSGDGSSGSFGSASGTPLSAGLQFDEEQNLVSRDGRRVPEVETIGVGALLAVAAIVAALVMLPPLLLGGGALRNRTRRGGAAQL